ncbi:hypothetical protein HII36_08555 [Nonomuraea sp. NN258]|nr:hypothetical protein [Nonomuraea antri]NRQ31889.1 hypothetical protein [Nonomuraea antri]
MTKSSLFHCGTPGLDAVGPLRQVAERAEEENGVRALVRHGQVPCVGGCTRRRRHT